MFDGLRGIYSGGLAITKGKSQVGGNRYLGENNPVRIQGSLPEMK